jgi:lipoyl(octanoyl) transferase
MFMQRTPVLRQLGLQPYAPIHWRMSEFTDQRNQQSADELWALEHPKVYTLGQAADTAHVLNAGQIPVVKTDRGGQVTYHGPGQLVLYCLVDLRRHGIGVRSMVTLIEASVIDYLQRFDIDARSRDDAPGVYVGEAKIAALGLRVRKGCTFHGLSLNVDMDLEPFSRINPCGYQGLAVTQLSDLGVTMTPAEVAADLGQIFSNRLSAAPVQV